MSAFTFVLRQEGKLGPRMLAFHVTTFIARITVLIAISVLAVASILMPQLKSLSSGYRVEALLIAAAIWTLHFPFVLEFARQEVDAQIVGERGSFVVKGLIASFLLFAASVLALLIANSR